MTLQVHLVLCPEPSITNTAQPPFTDTARAVNTGLALATPLLDLWPVELQNEEEILSTGEETVLSFLSPSPYLVSVLSGHPGPSPQAGKRSRPRRGCKRERGNSHNTISPIVGPEAVGWLAFSLIGEILWTVLYPPETMPQPLQHGTNREESGLGCCWSSQPFTHSPLRLRLGVDMVILILLASCIVALESAACRTQESKCHTTKVLVCRYHLPYI